MWRTTDQDRQRLGRRPLHGADKDLQKFSCRNSIILHEGRSAYCRIDRRRI